jgi:hypothetical protein
MLKATTRRSGVERKKPGETIAQGTIAGWTLTAYEVKTPEGETVYVPYPVGPPAVPLVQFGGLA